MNFEQERAPGLPWLALLVRTRPLGATTVVALYVVLGALTLSPLLWVTTPALVDYPNHLARMWILVHGRDIPELASNYVAHWRLVPNLAMDIVVPALAKVMPVELAGRVFIALTMALPVAGTAALHRALYGRVGLWPLTSLLFVYSAALFWGFLNSLFGLGLCLLTFSAWVLTPGWKALPRLALFAVAACILFVAHLFAVALYGFMVISYEGGLRMAQRRLSRADLLALVKIGMQFIPAAGLWYVSLLGGGPTYTSFGSIKDKIYAALSPVSFGAASLPFDGLLFLFCLAFLCMGIVSRSIHLKPEMRLPLIALAVAAALTPNWLSGSWASDIRLPVAIVFILIGSIRIDTGQFRLIGFFTVGALAVLAMRIWIVSESWRDYDSRYEEFRVAATTITPGSRVLVTESPLPEAQRAIAGLPTALAARWPVNFLHLPSLAVIDRSVFIPYLFTGLTTIRPTERNAGLFWVQGAPLSPELLAAGVSRDRMGSFATTPNFYGDVPYWGDWPRHFTFVLSIDFNQPALAELENLELVTGGSFFHIYRVVGP